MKNTSIRYLDNSSFLIETNSISNNYEITQMFKEKLKASETKIVVINKRGQKIC